MNQQKVLKKELNDFLRIKTDNDSMKIFKEELDDFIRMKFFTELTLIKEKIALFEKKYKSDFLRFETSVKNAQKENFEQWDDYMEWKAFHNKFIELQERAQRI